MVHASGSCASSTRHVGTSSYPYQLTPRLPVPHLLLSWCTSLLRSRCFRHLKVPPCLLREAHDSNARVTTHEQHAHPDRSQQSRAMLLACMAGRGWAGNWAGLTGDGLPISSA